MNHENLDVIIKTKDGFQFIMVDRNEETEGYKISTVNNTFTKDEIVNAFKLTGTHNYSIAIDEFETIDGVLHYLELVNESVHDVDVYDALNTMIVKDLDVVVYSLCQK